MCSLSVGPSVSDSIWGVVCKHVHWRNNQAQRVKLYLKWKNNSHNIRELIKSLNPTTSSQLSIPTQPLSYPPKSLLVSYSIDSSTEWLASLPNSTIYRDIVQCLQSACSFQGSAIREEFFYSIDPDLLDYKILLILIFFLCI